MIVTAWVIEGTISTPSEELHTIISHHIDSIPLSFSTGVIQLQLRQGCSSEIQSELWYIYTIFDQRVWPTR